MSRLLLIRLYLNKTRVLCRLCNLEFYLSDETAQDICANCIETKTTSDKKLHY